MAWKVAPGPLFYGLSPLLDGLLKGFFSEMSAKEHKLHVAFYEFNQSMPPDTDVDL